MPIVESASLAVEVAKWSYELYKLIRAYVGYAFSPDGFRTISSLSTLEFSFQGNTQIAHYVQDREIIFTRPGNLPAFLYATSGQDSIDSLFVENMPVAYKVSPKIGSEPVMILPAKAVEYPKNFRLSTAMVAHSANGYISATETQNLTIKRWVGKSSIAVIFPEDKKPIQFALYYRDRKDGPSVRRHPGYTACFLKKTTRERWVLLWEVSNAKPGKTYILEWTWP
jgi:hypothetical protein